MAKFSTSRTVKLTEARKARPKKPRKQRSAAERQRIAVYLNGGGHYGGVQGGHGNVLPD